MALAGGAAGPVLGKGLQFVGREVGNLGKFIANAFGKEATKAAEDLRSGINAETGKALTAEERKIAEAKVQEGVARAKQAAAEAETKRLDEAQERLRNRMQERVKAAEAAAERVGQNVEQAKDFAAHQEAAIKKAEESATKLAEDFAARPTMPPEEFGRQLQETAVKDAEALTKERKVKSGFEAAVKSDGGRPSIPTKQFIVAVREAEKRAVSPAAKSALNSLDEALRSKADGGTVTAVSIEKARRIVQDLDSRIEGMPSDEAHEITALKDKFVAHMETVHPRLAEARKKYAELSRPLDVYRDTGALAKSILEDPYSGRAIVDPTKTVGALLNKTEASADALGRLIQVNPALKDSARKYFNQQLVDLAGKNATPTELQFATFLKNNRLALNRAGPEVEKDFKDLASAKTAQERIAAQAKAGAGVAKQAVSSAERVSAEAEKTAAEARRLKEKVGAAGAS